MNHLRTNEWSDQGGFVVALTFPLGLRVWHFKMVSNRFMLWLQSCPLYLCLWNMIDILYIC